MVIERTQNRVAILRVMVRSVALLVVLLAALADFPIQRLRKGGPLHGQDQAVWMQRWARIVLCVFGVTCNITGPVPQEGLVVSNHVSYLDILVLTAAHPGVFISKKEVKNWPLFGWLAQCAGTIFVLRRTRDDLPAVTAAMVERLRQGESVMLFPEGTSSNGDGILPFHAALFESAVQARVPVTPAYLRYATLQGQPEPLAYYWGDAILMPHIFRLLGTKSLYAELRFSPEAKLFEDRHAAATWAHGAIEGLQATSGHQSSDCMVVG